MGTRFPDYVPQQETQRSLVKAMDSFGRSLGPEFVCYSDVKVAAAEVLAHRLAQRAADVPHSELRPIEKLTYGVLGTAARLRTGRVIYPPAEE